jgi:hypothetical protein
MVVKVEGWTDQVSVGGGRGQVNGREQLRECKTGKGEEEEEGRRRQKKRKSGGVGVWMKSFVYLAEGVGAIVGYL